MRGDRTNGCPFQRAKGKARRAHGDCWRGVHATQAASRGASVRCFVASPTSWPVPCQPHMPRPTAHAGHGLGRFLCNFFQRRSFRFPQLEIFYLHEQKSGSTSEDEGSLGRLPFFLLVYALRCRPRIAWRKIFCIYTNPRQNIKSGDGGAWDKPNLHVSIRRIAPIPTPVGSFSFTRETWEPRSGLLVGFDRRAGILPRGPPDSGVLVWRW